MDQKVPIIRQDPFRLHVALKADGMLAQLLQLDADFVGYSLYLLRVRAGTNNEIVGERGDGSEIQNPDVGGFFGLGSLYRCEPRGLRKFLGRLFFLNFANLCQETLPQPISYYKRVPCIPKSSSQVSFSAS